GVVHYHAHISIPLCHHSLCHTRFYPLVNRYNAACKAFFINIIMLGGFSSFNIYYHIARWVHRIFMNVQHLVNIVSANVYFTHIAISLKGTLAGMVIYIMAHTTTVVYHRQQTVLLVPEHTAVFHHEEV